MGPATPTRNEGALRNRFDLLEKRMGRFRATLFQVSAMEIVSESHATRQPFAASGLQLDSSQGFQVAAMGDVGAQGAVASNGVPLRL